MAKNKYPYSERKHRRNVKYWIQVQSPEDIHKSGEGAHLYLDMIANYSGIPTQIAMLVIVCLAFIRLLPFTTYNFI